MRPGRWAANLLLLGLSLTAALALTEAAVRLFAPQPTGTSHHDRFGLVMHYPGITRFLSRFGHEVSFNSAGMRDREHATRKPAGVFRILLLGDSFMEAFQVPFEAALPSLLENSLAQSTGKRIEVINAGVSGWGTDDELRYLTTYGVGYEPDLVLIAMTLHNDISDNLFEEWHTLQDNRLVEHPVAPMPFWRYKVVGLKAFIATHFQTYQLWRRVRHGAEMRQTGRQLDSHIVQLFREPPPARIDWGFDFTARLLERMKAVTDSSGAQIALLLLPLRVQLSDSEFAEFERSAGVGLGELPREKPQQRMTAIAESLGIPLLDLLPSFRGWVADSAESLYVPEDGHWNNLGHALAGRIVADWLSGAVRFD